MSGEEIKKVLKFVTGVLGYDEVYAVGGPVRDYVLGKEPNDVDIASKLRPWEVVMLGLGEDPGGLSGLTEDELKKVYFSPEKLDEFYMKTGVKIIPTGLDFGTITLHFKIDGRVYDVEHTTFRREEYRDNRKPIVSYTEDLVEDLSRRDFTINAMAARLDGDELRIIDPFGGMEDVEKGIVRSVGDPYERFYEDPLRIMRLARFAARYNFEMDFETVFAAREVSGLLISERVSVERIRDEFLKGLKKVDDPKEYIKNLETVGVVDVVFPNSLGALRGVPQQPKYHYGDVYTHTLDVMSNVKRFSSDAEKYGNYVFAVRKAYEKYVRDWRYEERKLVKKKAEIAKNGGRPIGISVDLRFSEYLERELGMSVEDMVKRGIDLAVFSAALSVVRNVEVELDVERLLVAAMYHDVGKAVIYRERGASLFELLENDIKWHYSCHPNVGYRRVVEELKGLRYSNAEVDEVSKLVLAHDVGMNPKELAKYFRYITSNGRDPVILAKLMVLKKADMYAHTDRVVLKYPEVLRAFLDVLDRPLSTGELRISYDRVYDIVRKYGKYSGEKEARVIAGKIYDRLVYESWHLLENNEFDLEYRAVELAKSGYTGKNPYKIVVK